MNNIAINMIWFTRVKTSSDYVFFKNLLSGFLGLKKTNKQLVITVFINEKYKSDVLKFIKELDKQFYIKIVTKIKKHVFFTKFFKEYDLVFTPNWYFPIEFGKENNKFISLVHDAGWKKKNPFSIRAIYGRFVLPLSSKFLRHQLVYTTGSVNSDYTGFKKVIGVPILPYNQIIKEKVPFKKYFLIISTNLPHKNLSVIREIMNQKNIDFNLVLVGNHKSFKLKNVKIYKNITNEYKWNLITNCLALINPSKYEGFGMPVAEAMIKNKYVIAANLEVYREYIENGLITVKDCDNIIEWANKLLEVWNNNKKFLEKKYGKPKINKDFIQPKKVANRVINLAKEN